jgi:hypothetical protein
MLCEIVENRNVFKYVITVKDDSGIPALVVDATFINNKYVSGERRPSVGVSLSGVREWEAMQLMSQAIVDLRNKHEGRTTK